MADLKIVLTVIDKDTGKVTKVRKSLADLAGEAAVADQKAAGLGSTLADLGNELTGLGKFAGVAGLALGIAAVGSRLLDASAAASRLNETMSKSAVIFGGAAAGMAAFGDKATKALGMTKQAAMEAAANVGNLFLGAGVNQSASAALSRNIVRLAADLSSFNDMSTEEALEKLRSGLVGEAEPLRTVGVLLSETAVQQKAMKMGLVEGTAALTEQDKVLARYALIMEQTGKAQGDLARTSDSDANATRRLSAEQERAAGIIGGSVLPIKQALTNATADFVGWMNTETQVAQKDREVMLASMQAGKSYAEALRLGAAAGRELRAELNGVASGLEDVNLKMSRTVTLLPDVAAGARDAAKALKEMEAERKAALGRALDLAEQVDNQYDVRERERWGRSVDLAKEKTQEIAEAKAKAEQEVNRAASEAESAAKRSATEAATALKQRISEGASAAAEAVQKLQDAISNLGRTPVQGSKAFSDRRNALEDQIKAGELRIANLKLSGGSKRDIRDKVNAEEKRLEDLQLRLSQVNLQEQVSLDPQRRKIDQAINPALPEMSAGTILSRIADLRSVLPSLEGVANQAGTYRDQVNNVFNLDIKVDSANAGQDIVAQLVAAMTSAGIPVSTQMAGAR